MRRDAFASSTSARGEYEPVEKIIQRLLVDAGATGIGDGVVWVDPGGVEAAADWENLQSSENYVGYQRTEHFAYLLAAPSKIRRGSFISLRRDWPSTSGLLPASGRWAAQAAVLNKPGGRIAYRFHARDLHLVMKPPRRGVAARFRVSIDGQPPGPAHGLDVNQAGNGTVNEQRLYQLIRQPAPPIVDRTFEIEFLDAGVETLAFTFG